MLCLKSNFQASLFYILSRTFIISLKSNIVIYRYFLSHKSRMDVLSHHSRLTSLTPFPKAYLHYDTNVPGECWWLCFFWKGERWGAGQERLASNSQYPKEKKSECNLFFYSSIFIWLYNKQKPLLLLKGISQEILRMCLLCRVYQISCFKTQQIMIELNVIKDIQPSLRIYIIWHSYVLFFKLAFRIC